MGTCRQAPKALHGLAVAAAVAALAPAPAAAFSLSYAYRLSTLTGVVRTSWAALSPDRQNRELLVVAGDLVHVFNDAGMEVHRFGDDEALGRIVAVAALDDGDLVALAYRGSSWKLLKLDYRGELSGPLEPSGVPAALAAGFHPNALAAARSRLYLADPGTMRVLVLGTDGGFVASYDLSRFAEEDRGAERERDGRAPGEGAAATISGFGVDGQGNLLFTIAPLFKVFVVSPDGTARSFGKPGGTPGKFGIVAGVAADDAGRLYVADTLKEAVIVFDHEFNFLGEYGTSARPSDRLLGPREVAVMSGKVYVAQNGRRGVSVFRVGD